MTTTVRIFEILFPALVLGLASPAFAVAAEGEEETEAVEAGWDAPFERSRVLGGLSQGLFWGGVGSMIASNLLYVVPEDPGGRLASQVTGGVTVGLLSGALATGVGAQVQARIALGAAGGRWSAGFGEFVTGALFTTAGVIAWGFVLSSRDNLTQPDGAFPVLIALVSVASAMTPIGVGLLTVGAAKVRDRAAEAGGREARRVVPLPWFAAGERGAVGGVSLVF